MYNRMRKILLSVALIGLLSGISGCGKQMEADKTEEESEGLQQLMESVAEIEEQEEKEAKEIAEQEEKEANEEQPVENAAEESSEIEENNEIEEKAKEIEQARIEAESKVKISILGDSLSAYEGYVPAGYSIFFPQNGEIKDINQMWWKPIVDKQGRMLCGNSSSSGSTCSGDSTSKDNPMYGCSDYRIAALSGAYGLIPDKIIVYIGTNDFLGGVPLGENDGTKAVAEGNIENFSDAYTLMLDKIKKNYPTAEIFCATLTEIGDWGTDTPFVTFTNGLGLTVKDYNKVIRQLAGAKGCSVIELENCGITIENMPQYISDGVHLKPDGMTLIRNIIESSIG